VRSGRSCRMPKQSLFSPTQPRCAKTHLSPSSVLPSFRPSTLSRSFSKVRNAEGAFPFAKTHCKGERPTRSAVYTSSPFTHCGLAWDKARPRAESLSWQTQGGRLK
jgi:hypothetical protein